MYKTALAAGIIIAALSVILGAFGAHALRPLLTIENAQTFETAVRYQMYHSFALLSTGMLFAHYPHRHLKTATSFFITGIVLFSGSLYGLTALKASGAAGLSGLGILTPIGGLFLIGGWFLLLLGILKKK